MKALARKNGFLMADVPRDARLVHIIKDLAAGSSGMVMASDLACGAAAPERCISSLTDPPIPREDQFLKHADGMSSVVLCRRVPGNGQERSCSVV